MAGTITDRKGSLAQCLFCRKRMGLYMRSSYPGSQDVQPYRGCIPGGRIIEEIIPGGLRSA